MSNDRQVFSFELNEALYFEKGQEVAEMKEISLDPEISIQSFNEYISIRGVIELQGSYQRILSSEVEEDTLEFEDYHSKRYVERVVDKEDGIASFSHRFPVEISVPTYRVADIDDVTVYIESFDYEVPDQSQLRLYSTIEIHGINNYAENDNKEEDQEQEENSPQNIPEESFQFEIKRKEEAESINDPQISNTTNIPSLPAESNTEINTETNTETNKEMKEKDRWKYKESKTFAEFFGKESSNEEAYSPESDESSAISSEAHYESDDYESMESRSEKEKVEDVSYLSDMFRSSTEEQYTKMRLCIVQEKDTIESIAERYKITTLQLIKQNRLDDEEYNVSEGQLLYIPTKKR
ncbi:stage VI sporulation protein D [Virgibacillus sp. C22-A2]|uniref:Stage VI sporulation protein D n=1 Tax=Virgibacillus tibetensis TaxID=3042313 RepID=A0ABU6K9J6_9BACI|nr:stage VI sporulation protein D [Virgibacillus sp. C22-A2]